MVIARVFQGQFQEPDVEYSLALALEILYHVETETYDRSVCTHVRNGVAIPATERERRLSFDYARRARERTLAAARTHGVSADALARARRSRVFTSEAAVASQVQWANETLARFGEDRR